MGYITLAEPGEERGLPKSGNAEGCTITISALGGITVRTATTPQGQGHRTVIAQVVADRLGVEPAAIEVLAEVDTSTSPWTIASGNYSSRFSGVGVGAAAAAADRLAEKIAAIRAHLGDESASLRRVAGTAHWNPEALPAGMEPGLAVTAYYAAPNLLPPDAEDRIASSASHGFVADVAVVEIDRDTGEVDGARLRHRPRRRPPAEPAARRGPGAGRPRPRSRGRALRAPRLRRGRQPAHGVVHGLPRADGARPADAEDRPPRVADAVPPARREGPRRGDDDERPGRRSRTRSRTRSGATTSSRRSRRVASGSCSRREAASVRVRAARVARRGAVGARRRRRRREGARGRTEPRPRPEHARAPPGAARGREPRRRPRRGRAAGRARSSSGRPCARPTLGFAPIPCSPLSSPTSGTRSRATAEPSADRSRTPTRLRSCPLALVATGGSAVVASVRGRREIPADELFLGPYTTALAPDELLVETRLAAYRPESDGFAFEELAQRERRLRAVHGGGARPRRRAPRRRRLGHADADGARRRSRARPASRRPRRSSRGDRSTRRPAYLRQLVRVLVDRAVARAREAAA